MLNYYQTRYETALYMCHNHGYEVGLVNSMYYNVREVLCDVKQLRMMQCTVSLFDVFFLRSSNA